MEREQKTALLALIVAVAGFEELVELLERQLNLCKAAFRVITDPYSKEYGDWVEREAITKSRLEVVNVAMDTLTVFAERDNLTVEDVMLVSQTVHEHMQETEKALQALGEG